jgi:ATP-dependent Clp protease ATP-binding subunit ClpA
MMFREAEAAGDPHVGSEHLALAALDGPSGLHEIAAAAGVAPELLRDALLTCCPHPKVAGEAGATVRVTRLVAIATHAAMTEGSRQVESRHLVRALLAAPGAVAWTGLASAGLDHATARSLFPRVEPLGKAAARRVN